MATEDDWLQGTDDEAVIRAYLEYEDKRHEAFVEEQMERQYQEQYSDQLAHELLHLPLGENDAQAATVGEYLGLLLSTLWLQADGFSGKRPFGNSDWQYPVYTAMIKAGFVEGSVYEDEGYWYIDDFLADQQIAADELILLAIRLAYNHG